MILLAIYITVAVIVATAMMEDGAAYLYEPGAIETCVMGGVLWPIMLCLAIWHIIETGEKL